MQLQMNKNYDNKIKECKKRIGMKQIVLIVIVVLGVLVFFWIFVSAMQCTAVSKSFHECIWIAYVVLVGIALVAVVVGYQTFRAITA